MVTFQGLNEKGALFQWEEDTHPVAVARLLQPEAGVSMGKCCGVLDHLIVLPPDQVPID
jgi:hypothetical protein